MNYGMWRYAGFMKVCGVQRARRRRYGGYTRYSPPTYWQKLGRSEGRPDAARLPGGEDRQSLPRLEARGPIVLHPADADLVRREDQAIRLSAELRLEEEEIAFLLDAKKTSKKVVEDL